MNSDSQYDKCGNLIHCVECDHMLACGDQGHCIKGLARVRAESRLRLSKLSVGERFALMFGHKLPSKEPTETP